ncbi:cytochrome P450 [Rhizobium johnstonii]|jgi:cytochrome P450|nr:MULTISPECIES: cytochrome P450 [Rhizobium]QND16926.1 cytochrome P450 [Rhizobium leguminosarum bv. trifolii]NEI11069.1 cytochrome P450 [Rhizobium ruizarguesonis]NEI59410.1 cytochrome P450 [Rhizobium leguminosarum]NEI88250.1 cytochrome P450 [Rhizobium leguminosarum]TAV41149.1 cytochrome P450 [Rhizobium leguminosarum]
MTSSLKAVHTRAPKVVTIAELEADPHGVFKRHRGSGPFIQRDDGVYLAIRASEVNSLLNDELASQVEPEVTQVHGLTKGALFNLCNNAMLTSTGAKYGAWRATLVRTFTFSMIDGLRPRVRSYANEIIDQHQAKNRMELLTDYASLIPARTAAFVLGIPREDEPKFTSLVSKVARIFGYAVRPEEILSIEKAAQELNDYVEALIEFRRRNPRGDFLSEYVAAVDGKSELTSLEAVMQIVSVILAGSNATHTAMVIQTALLLKHRTQWNTLCDYPGLVPKAVVEALRFEPPIASACYLARDTIEIEGQTLPAGALVSLMTISVMRDEQIYPHPDRLDILRGQPHWHPILGGGVRGFLGEALAKIELEEGLLALITRLPDLHADGEQFQVKGHTGLRRISPLHLRWS